MVRPPGATRLSDENPVINEHLVPFLGTAEAVACLLHPHAEVVVHDIESNQIAAIFNNSSGRRIGSPSGIEDVDGLMSGAATNGPFRKTTMQGREIKYVSSVLRDAAGRAVGLMCINLDVTALRGWLEVGQRFLESVQGSASFDALFDDDWQERIDVFVRQHVEARRLHPGRLNRAQRLELVAALKDAGAFQAKSSANYVANVLGVSRSTVYNDLGRLEKHLQEDREEEPPQ